MNKLYPIKFKAEPRERVWGGKYLVKTLKKEFEEDPEKGGIEQIENKKIGESWEIWSLYGGGSIAKNGFLAENPIDDIIETYMGDFMGEELFQYYHGNFPLMVKILDIRDRLSVQLHPDDTTAFEREDSYGKAEFWYIMEAEPDAEIYMGFNRDMTPQELYDRAKNGTLQEVLNMIKPKKGDCFYIEPGCVHSAGNGVVIAEITESSDITYRIYDWGRENDPKTARKMHLEEAIDIINYSKYDQERFFQKEVKESRLVANTEYFMDLYI
jgi:mannose-6-phosphate isomerase